MAWIRVINEDEADKRLKEGYARVRTMRGELSNILMVDSLRPDILKIHLDLYLALLFGDSGLSRIEREMIATIVSKTNGCRYCTTHHSEALSRAASEPQLVQQLLENHGKASIPEKDMRMLEFAKKLTKSPKEIEEEDIKALKDVGFKDRDILDIVLIASYFNYVNRLALGLGVELEKGRIFKDKPFDD